MSHVFLCTCPSRACGLEGGCVCMCNVHVCGREMNCALCEVIGMRNSACVGTPHSPPSGLPCV